MQDPILGELRRVRARYLKEMEQDIHRSVARSNDLLYKICDVVLSPTGDTQFVVSAKKMHDALIAPRQPAR